KLALAKSHVPASAPVIGTVVTGTPADRAGLRPWERLVAANGQPVHSWETWRTHIQNSPERVLHVGVLRADGEHTLVITPVRSPDGSGAAGLGRGIERTPVGLAGAGAFARKRFASTLDLVKDSWRILFTGRLSV